MAKKPASTSLEEALYQRVARVAKVDRRSIAQILEICVEKALPELEAEQLTLKEEAPVYQAEGKPSGGSLSKQGKKVA